MSGYEVDRAKALMLNHDVHDIATFDQEFNRIEGIAVSS